MNVFRDFEAQKTLTRIFAIKSGGTNLHAAGSSDPKCFYTQKATRGKAAEE
jgi:hypothetical protein